LKEGISISEDFRDFLKDTVFGKPLIFRPQTRAEALNHHWQKSLVIPEDKRTGDGSPFLFTP